MRGIKISLNAWKNPRLAGRSLPVKLYQALFRPSEVSLQFARWLRSELMKPNCYTQALANLRPLMKTYL